MPKMKTVGQTNLKLLDTQAFYSQGPCDLDLWPSKLKINRGYLLIMTNLHAKYEDCGLKVSLVIGQTNFLKSRSLWTLTRLPQNQ
jgi:hypothetical protein